MFFLLQIPFFCAYLKFTGWWLTLWQVTSVALTMFESSSLLHRPVAQTVSSWDLFLISQFVHGDDTFVEKTEAAGK